MRKSVNWQNSKAGTLLNERILILDGAMGTMIQDQDPSFPEGSRGNNDILVLSAPELILSIHKEYVNAGADIICTNTFNANGISQEDYGTADQVYEMNLEAAHLARKSGALLVAGSIGPTNKSASIPPQAESPGKRAVDFQTLANAYRDQIRGLREGGVDLFLLETVFDTLNAKAALFVLAEEAPQIPIMLSATIADRSGRVLSGQTIEAFLASTEHANLLSVGLNCSFGPDQMLPFMRTMARSATVFTAAYPNAGFPDMFGKYHLSAEEMSRQLKPFVEERLINVLGGCCGTGPAHIAALAAMVKKGEKTYGRRVLPEDTRGSKVLLSGLEALTISDSSAFLIAGERTNVAGSRRFARLIAQEKYDEALDIARTMVEDGAHILDINMDDALLDAPAAMKEYLLRLGADPDIAKVPLMLDSSSWDVLQAGLECVQGKSIVNSLSLKEGEDEFLRKARMVRRYGAAVLIMAFDEQGQATTFERRIEICTRAFTLLTEKAGFKPRDIFLDPNVLAVATGMEEHRHFAVDFIESVKYLKENLKGVLLSAGVSNLSFSFRGNEAVREAMHAVFLYHAIAAGLDMAILKPGAQPVYSEIPETVRVAVEDVILDTDTGATTRLIEVAAATTATTVASTANRAPEQDTWRDLTPEQRVIYALVHGREQSLKEDLKAMQEVPAIEIVETTLMEGMNRVGKLFGEGKMFLPQVVKTARTMKHAVSLLQPRIEAEKTQTRTAKQTLEKTHGIMATVKGDVHDIGKNLVSLVMECNNYKITDLGVMVPSHKIVEAAKKENASFVGLSGLITPSLDEMTEVARNMQKEGLTIPLLIGGATTSALFTALRIAPEYDGVVIHCPDAAGVVSVLSDCFSKEPGVREQFLESLRTSQIRLRESWNSKKSEKEYLSKEQARSNRWVSVERDDFIPPFTGIRDFTIPFKTLRSYIKWNGFLKAWEVQDHAIQADLAIRDAKDMLDKLEDGVFGDLAFARAAVGFWPAFSTKEDHLVFYTDKGCRQVLLELELERDLQKYDDGSPNVCLTDFVAQQNGSCAPGYAGLFLLTASSPCLEALTVRMQEDGDVYNQLLLKTLLDVLAEACSEYLHRKFMTHPEGSTRGIRPAFGYPSCPDHALKEPVVTLLQKEKNLEVVLTSSFMLRPAASVCGMYISHPQAFYFTVNKL
ncbi:MAG: methionine synthase [Bacteroidales bacterium]|nr:methionine synthase [Bacteroidales bacterium]